MSFVHVGFTRGSSGTATSAVDGASSWHCGGSCGGLGADIADCWDWELALSSSEQGSCCASSSMVGGITGLLVWAVCWPCWAQMCAGRDRRHDRWRLQPAARRSVATGGGTAVATGGTPVARRSRPAAARRSRTGGALVARQLRGKEKTTLRDAGLSTYLLTYLPGTGRRRSAAFPCCAAAALATGGTGGHDRRHGGRERSGGRARNRNPWT